MNPLPNLAFSPLLLTASACGLTLLTLAWATPRQWWRQLTAGGLLLCLAVGMAWWLGLQALLQYVQGAGLASGSSATAPAVSSAAKDGPQLFWVKHSLHLRQQAGTSGALLHKLPARTWVLAHGPREGDWWQVQSCLDGSRGWVSSLWLRRAQEWGEDGEGAGEGAGAALQGAQLAKCEMRKPLSVSSHSP